MTTRKSIKDVEKKWFFDTDLPLLDIGFGENRVREHAIRYSSMNNETVFYRVWHGPYVSANWFVLVTEVSSNSHPDYMEFAGSAGKLDGVFTHTFRASMNVKHFRIPQGSMQLKEIEET